MRALFAVLILTGILLEFASYSQAADWKQAEIKQMILTKIGEGKAKTLSVVLKKEAHDAARKIEVTVGMEEKKVTQELEKIGGAIKDQSLTKTTAQDTHTKLKTEITNSHNSIQNDMTPLPEDSQTVLKRVLNRNLHEFSITFEELIGHL